MTNLFKFYYDLLSPSSRSLLILLDIAKVPCEKVSVALRKGEHLGLDFAQHVNRFNKIPAINHDGFRLSESVAIYHYLGRSTILPVQWYPGGTDLQKQTRIDEYLEWQQNNLFINAGMIFLQAWALPFISGKLPDDKLIQRLNRPAMKLQ